MAEERNRAGLVAALLLTVLALLAPGAGARTLEDEAAPSTALGHALPYAIWLPPGFDAEPGRRWPALYLLHGLGGNHREWLADGHLAETMDRLVATGEVPPMVVVMPAGGNSWYVDSAALGGPGDWERAIAADLPAEIERRWHVAATPAARGIAGLSMGGFGALRLAWREPYRYAAAAALSGAFWAEMTRDRKPGPHVEAIFSGAFGRPFDPARFLAASPFAAAGSLPPGTHLPPTFLTVGDNDRYRLWDDTFRLFRMLRGAGQPVEMRMTGGDHDWSTWAEELPDVLRFFGRTLRAE